MEITHNIAQQVCVIKLKQSLVADSVNTLSDYIESFIEDETIKGIIIVFENVSYIDSSGFGVLISIHQNLHEHQMKLALCNVSDRIQELFARLKLDQFLDTYSTEEEAITELMQS